MSTAPLESFIRKYQASKSYNSKEIRLTMPEAEELSTAVALLLSSNVVLQARIIDLQDRMLAEKTEIQVSGGGFT